ncbi:MAG: ATP-binding cassette domain-containing protein, partial [Magnetococcales bacterium]|nr:ATP-binding cassette domain-containing protein [Magnetococcales bacterium]
MPKDIRSLPEGVGQVSTVVVLGLTSLLINVLGLLMPLLMMQIFNRIIPNQSLSTLSMLVTAVLASLVVENALQTLRTHAIGWIGARFVHKGSCRLLRRLLFAEPREFERVDGAKYLEQMNAIHTIGDLYSGQAMLTLFDFPFLLMFLVILYSLGGYLVIVPLVTLTFITLFSTIMGEKLHKTLNKDMEVSQRRFSFITETLGRIHAVKSMAMEALMLRRYEMLQLTSLRHTYDIIFTGSIIPTFSAFASYANTALIVSLGATQVIEGEMTMGGLAACTMLAGRTLQPLQTLVRGWTRLQSSRMAQQQINALFTIPQRVEPVDSLKQVVIEGALDLQNVTCQFDKDPPILKNLSLSVKPTECIGLIGKSGDGKTTLLKLISGAVMPSQGAVLVDGNNRNTLPPHLHSSIGYIPQTGILFNATILENLTMFDESRNDIAINISTELGLDAIVSRMPKGYQTSIGEGVSDILPAGVIQRVAIIRILTMQPKILLFDEANTAIDSAGDILLRNYLEKLKGSCTIVLVSQRPSLLRITDRCFQFKDGALEPLVHFMDALTAMPAQPTAVQAEQTKVSPVVNIQEEYIPSDIQATQVANTVNWQEYLQQLKEQNKFTWCLKGLLEGLQWHGTGRQLAEAIPHLLGKLDLTDLCNVMANLNFYHKVDEGLVENVDTRLPPFLFVFNNGRAVVILKKLNNSEMLIVDGDNGKQYQTRLQGKGTAYFFSPQKQNVGQSNWVQSQLLRFRSLIWNIIGITILGSIMSVAMPLFVRAVYDRVIPTGSISTGVVLLIGTILALTIDAILRVRRIHLLAYIGTKIERSLGSIILNQIMGLPAS